MDKEKNGMDLFQDLMDQEEVTLSRKQLKELMQDAASEALAQYIEDQEQKAMTKEQIMKVKDRAERQRLIRENMALFK